MEPIVVRFSLWRYGIPLLGSAAIIAGSMRILIERSSWLAWVSLVVFGLCALVSASLFAHGRVRLIVDREGIFDPAWEIGTVRWADIKDAFLRRDSNEEMICFLLRDRDEFRSRLGAVARRINAATHATGYGDFTVNATRLGLPTKEVVEFALKRIAETQ